jgi:hypothetical protein
MRKDCSNMDGVIENFDAVLAIAPVKNRFDQDNFYPADGIVEEYKAVLADTPIGNAYDQDNFYPADGLDNSSKVIKLGRTKMNSNMKISISLGVGIGLLAGLYFLIKRNK